MWIRESNARQYRLYSSALSASDNGQGTQCELFYYFKSSEEMIRGGKN